MPDGWREVDWWSLVRFGADGGRNWDDAVMGVVVLALRDGGDVERERHGAGSGIVMSDLVKRTGIKAGTATVVCDRLEGRGWVRRYRVGSRVRGADRRLIGVELLEGGVSGWVEPWMGFLCRAESDMERKRNCSERGGDEAS